MSLLHAVTIAAIASISLIATAAASETPVLPDFSRGIPGAALEKKEENRGIETFRLKTQLSSKDFFSKLRTMLGPGWRKRPLEKEEMMDAAGKGRSKNAEVNLAVFEHSDFPGVSIRVTHFKHKKENNAASAEILVIRLKSTKAEHVGDTNSGSNDASPD